MGISPPIGEGIFQQTLAANQRYAERHTAARQQPAVTPVTPQKTEAEKRQELEILAERGISQYLATAVKNHNMHVTTGLRATTQEVEKNEPEIRAKRTTQEVLADAVRRHNQAQKKRGYFLPPKKDK
jgi:hypothetical protein